MIQIAGTDYEQATDKSIVAYNGAKHVLIANGDILERVLMSGFAEAGDPPAHDHDNDILSPRQIQSGSGWDFLRLKGTTSRIDIHNDDSYAGELIHLVSPSQVRLDCAYLRVVSTVGSYGLYLEGTPGSRHGLADGWGTYACSASLKDNITKITGPLERLALVDGITFMQDNIPGTGITAEHLDLLGLPGLTIKDANGKYTGINLTGCIPILVESVKELSAKVNNLESRLAALEAARR